MDFYSLLIIYVVEIIGAIVFAIYRMAYFSHKGDTEFGRLVLSKVYISLGMFMWVFPVVWVPMDVLLSSHSDTARTINMIIIQSTSGY